MDFSQIICSFVLLKKKKMQTLEFNTSTKTVKLTEGHIEKSNVLFEYENITTVKTTSFYYEVMQQTSTGVVPVLRTPISNTNMVIKK